MNSKRIAMKKFTKSLLAAFFCLFLLNNSYSQEVGYCNTSEMNQKLFDANPTLRAEYMEEQRRLEAIDKAAYANGYKDNSRAAGIVYTYPVVFHIIHQNGTENISDAQIKDAMRIINEDYRKLNSSFSTTDPAFKSIAVDCEIEFCLAKKDPNGNVTTGIDRIVSAKTSNADDGSRLNPWNTNMYLNIWVVKTLASGSSGYTYYPTSTAGSLKDGVLIQSTYVGSIGTGQPRWANNLSHEIGHYFNLVHTFEGGNTSTCGDDNVTDTPKSKQHNWSNNCPPTNDASCGSNANQNNYMDYTFCYTMFTAGQATRMRSSITGSNSRKNLWTAANLAATGCATTTGLSDELFYSINFNIFPNPADENTVIRFNVIEKQSAEIKIINVIGQEVASVFQGELNPGEHQYPLNKSKLKPGIYFVKFTLGNQSITKKVIVQQ